MSRATQNFSLCVSLRIESSFDHLFFIYMSKKEIYNNWKSYLESRRVQEDIKVQYLSYIKILLNNNVPIIFDFDHLSLLMGRTKFYMASVVNSPDNHYREFKLKKRSGGSRNITTPYPALLEMQYWIYNSILKKIPIHSSAHGFTYKNLRPSGISSNFIYDSFVLISEARIYIFYIPIHQGIL